MTEIKLIVIYKEIIILLIQAKHEYSDHNITDTFCEFFQQHVGFPVYQALTVIPRPEIPNL